MIIGWENSDSGVFFKQRMGFKSKTSSFFCLIEIVSYLFSVKYILLADLFLELSGC
jgi:hypothetical protein